MNQKRSTQLPYLMSCVREPTVSESYRGYLFINDNKGYARNVLSEPMNLKTRLSEVYSLIDAVPK